MTRGALEALDRDELQVMVAHEFSHIRHGDIRLNLQLAAAMTGLLVIAELAEQLDRPIQHQTSDQFWPEKTHRHANPLHSGCYLIGYGGVFFSELIKAAVNRQRETLADAAAVQFTRNPRALASALKKVAGHPYAPLIFHPASRSFSHLFFAQGLDSTFAGALATHPPLPSGSAPWCRTGMVNTFGIYYRCSRMTIGSWPILRYSNVVDPQSMARHHPGYWPRHLPP